MEVNGAKEPMGVAGDITTGTHRMKADGAQRDLWMASITQMVRLARERRAVHSERGNTLVTQTR